jgi:4-aminobutyrate aminotransferase-like enzyme
MSEARGKGRKDRKTAGGPAKPKSRAILTLNAFDPRRSGGVDGSINKLLRRRIATFGPISMLFYDHPLNFVRGEGAWMFDADGNAYLDVYNNVPSVGHAHPHVVEAIARQAALLNIHTRYLHDTVLSYAERLLATLPDSISNIAFTCTGSESNDLALQVARAATGRSGFVVTENAYHGNSSAVVEISPSSTPGRAPPRHVRLVPPPDPRRAPDGRVGAKFAADVRAAIADLEESGIGFAALVFDSIFSSDGVYADPPGLLGAAVKAAKKAGGLVIADEVQPGFARTGRHMWGFQRHRIAPDMVTMGKPMGNGYPIGAVAASPALFKAFTDRTGYFNTFGGSPVAAAAGMAVLDVLEGDGLMANARKVGVHLAKNLEALGKRHEALGAVRGAGLYVGVEFVADKKAGWTPDPVLARHVINFLRTRRILIGAAGPHGNVLKIRPPLCFSVEIADLLVTGIDDALKKGRGKREGPSKSRRHART